MTDRRSSYLNLISSTTNQCEPFHKNVFEYLNTFWFLVSTCEERAKLSNSHISFALFFKTWTHLKGVFKTPNFDDFPVYRQHYFLTR